jgi:hypothetical protein
MLTETLMDQLAVSIFRVGFFSLLYLYLYVYLYRCFPVIGFLFAVGKHFNKRSELNDKDYRKLRPEQGMASTITPNLSV